MKGNHGLEPEQHIIPASAQAGVQLLQRRGDAGAKELSTHRIRLEAGKVATFKLADEEAIVVLQEGRGTLAVGGEQWAVSRKDVFSERATAVFLPAGIELTIAAETALEAVAFSTPAPGGGKAVLVGPDQVRVNARGRGIYSREVHDIFVDDPHARRLMVGETFNPPGHWSSFPPHKHDGRDGEPTLEEVYYYRVDPPQGFGQQMLYTSGWGKRRACGPRRRCRAAALWLSPRGHAAGLPVVLPAGVSPESSAVLRCSKIRRTNGFTRHEKGTSPFSNVRSRKKVESPFPNCLWTDSG